MSFVDAFDGARVGHDREDVQRKFTEGLLLGSQPGVVCQKIFEVVGSSTDLFLLLQDPHEPFYRVCLRLVVHVPYTLRHRNLDSSYLNQKYAQGAGQTIKIRARRRTNDGFLASEDASTGLVVLVLLH